jgi:hypothetical protein
MAAETREWSTQRFWLFFRPNIRVGIDWHRLDAEQWPVRTYSLYQLEDLEFTLPWYTARGHEVSYNNPLATPLRLSAISDWFAQLRGERQRAIDRFCREYVSSRQPASLVLPVYRLNSERPGYGLALDSNHRLAALYLARVPFKIIKVVEICGPLDPIALPDLRHYVQT